MLRQILEKLFGLYAIGVFGIIAVTTLLVSFIVPGDMNRRRVARLGARVVFALTTGVPKLENAGELPQDPCIVVCNHASNLDGVILQAALPARFRYVIKGEMRSVPIVHFFLRRLGALMVERFHAGKSANDTRALIRAATNDDSLGIFPEGTFSRESGLRRFQRGAFVVAEKTGLPIVPAIISGSRDILPSKAFFPKPGRLTVTILPAIATANRDAGELAACARQRMLTHYTEPDLPDAVFPNRV